ncbi:hypothetical protein JXC34_05430 [Candidatus Woesearchaeota archaeon]|nr:hypothetical protein [Candidatus Woesearchaeota archaeon]
MKGKPLLPTLRTKKRYVVYETISEQPISHKDAVRAIEGSFKECFGSFALGMAGLMDTRIYSKNRGILKINNKYAKHLSVSMSMITEINKNPVIIHTAGVSGILKKAKTEVKLKN